MVNMKCIFLFVRLYINMEMITLLTKIDVYYNALDIGQK